MRSARDLGSALEKSPRLQRAESRSCAEALALGAGHWWSSHGSSHGSRGQPAVGLAFRAALGDAFQKVRGSEHLQE